MAKKYKKWTIIFGNDDSMTWAMDVCPPPTSLTVPAVEGCILRVDIYAPLAEGADPIDDRPVSTSSMIWLGGVSVHELFVDKSKR